jgi:uncharacterized membrane protein
MSENLQQQNNNNPQRVIKREAKFFSGPFPDPETLEHYQKIFPTAAERIFQLTEQQSKHRQKIENRVIWSNLIDSKLGLILGTIIALAIVYVAMKVILSGFQVTGFISIATVVTGIALSFFKGRESQRRELSRKKEDLDSI